MSDHHFSTGHRDPASLEAERLIEQRLEELRAVALGEAPSRRSEFTEAPSSWTSVEPTMSDDPLAAVLHPVAGTPISREPAPRLTVVPERLAPLAATPRYTDEQSR
ncbi:MAG: hypothetical protein H7123_03570, partial [Thermoleophilia bacterium]|nr:hypothetical protein [Thermoleophilia bacterium]